MKFTFREPGPFEGVKSHSKVVSRSAGDDDKVCIDFKSDELAINEESARSMMWCFDGVTGSVCPCTD